MTSPDRVKFLTVHSPVKPYRIVWLRSMLKIGEIFPGIMGIRPLDAVYFTRWSIVTSIPYNGRPQVRERLGHPYLFWETAFSGATEPYIESFVYLIQKSIKRAWGTSFGFPGVRSVTKVREYIENLAYPAAHAYSAYRRRAYGWSCPPCGSNASRNSSWTRPGPPRQRNSRWCTADSSNAGRATYEPRPERDNALLRADPDPFRGAGDPRRVPGDDPGRRAEPVPPARPDPSRPLGHHRPGRAGLPGAPPTPRPLRMQYLLFTSTFNGELGEHLEELRLRAGAETDAIWGHCIGYPGRRRRASFHRYFRHNRLPTTLSFAAYQSTIVEVRTALEVRDAHIPFAVRAQSLRDEDLQAAFIEHFGIS